MAVVYLIRLNLDGLYKIGCCSVVTTRYNAKRSRDAIISTIQVPDGVDMFAFERSIHAKFDHVRENRPAEHFRLSPQDIELFRSLAQPATGNLAQSWA